MTGRQLRARVLLEEARVLGLDLDDLIAADTSGSVAFPTVHSYLDAIASTFTPATAATYRPYWRLLIVHVGDHRLGEVTIVELTAVVEDAAATYRPYWRLLIVHVGDHRLGEVTIVELNFVVEDAAVGAQRRRPGSTGRASRETCVAALRAVFRRAVDTGLVTDNPAAALTKPRRVRSRHRALDERELGELIDAVRTTSNDPDLDLLLVRFHLESGARRQGALNLRRRDVDPIRATVWTRLRRHLRGVFVAMRNEIPAMLQHGVGAIVNVFSTAGLQAVGGLTAYVSTKHGLEGLTKVAALDYAEHGVRVNAIAPGPILTDNLRRAGEAGQQAAAAAMPMRCIGQPEEVAGAAVWLCSDNAGFVTGTTLVIDGGKLAGTPPFTTKRNGA